MLLQHVPALPKGTSGREVPEGRIIPERGRLMRIRSPGPQRALPTHPERRQPGRRGHQVDSGAVRAALGKGL